MLHKTKLKKETVFGVYDIQLIWFVIFGWLFHWMTDEIVSFE